LRTKETPIPKDFKVTDNIREYCARKWSLLYLPDVFLSDFLHTFDPELTGKKAIKHVNWETTFKTYIRNESPSGKYYGFGKRWDTRCEQARRHKTSANSVVVVRADGAVGHNNTNEGICGDTKRESGTFIPASPVAKAAIKQMKDLLKPYENLLK